METCKECLTKMDLIVSHETFDFKETVYWCPKCGTLETKVFNVRVSFNESDAKNFLSHSYSWKHPKIAKKIGVL